ncbi:Crp/Fnr family transcriptional regulator [Hymenobacter gummosus]|uniref:Crp/Fnr family transcriptional regulator n=1 Tax=Hymenobacter gummosus TaxID=1776032 RepID=A0A431U569_9BACT|nr:Crp/Fnr family transcriptional regulator [Hymenobacter gummosus]RTQ50924.1 Crp/Fnr family transcriptional regulator [Hymenobacter gummosus]
MQQQLRAHIERIVPLTDDEFAFVGSHFTARTFRRHQFLIQPGEPVRYFYFVVQGLLKLVYTDDTGKPHIISFALEDWWESDFQAFYLQTPATLSLECVEPTEVLGITLADYRRMCAGLPKMEHFFLEKALLGNMAAQNRILSFLTTSAQQRYEQLARRSPQLIRRLPKTLLASYLGVSRETLSRLSG